jgi:glyoxylase-like metal-dependent hydrolase (beta-lactamase superfamily II)
MLAALTASALLVAWTAAEPDAYAQAPAERPLEIVELQPNLFMIAGAGGNIAVQTGADGVILVDSGSGTRSADVLAAIRRMSGAPIRYIINTSASPDVVGGNEAIAAAGEPFAGRRSAFGADTSTATILGHENVLLNMSAPAGEPSPFPVNAWPAEGFISKRDLYLNAEGIEVIHVPAAYSNADSVVFFRRSDVVVAGEVLDATRFPRIDRGKGGSIDGVIAAVNKLIDLAIPPIPLAWQEGGTAVIPVRGRVFREADLVEYRDMLVIIRDVVRQMVDQGMTLEAIKKAGPTTGYNGRFGATTGPWTTDMFVEAVHAGVVGAAR